MAESTVDHSWDVIVIGAGPVGENAADRARRAGLTVAVVEKHLVGGECSFYACSPSKALLRPVLVTHASQRVQGSEGARVDREGVLARRDTWIDNLSDKGAVGWLESAGIDLVRGTGRLSGERRVQVDGRLYEARHAVIVATGTAPQVPDLPGLRDANPWTNRDATTSRRVPERLVVLGGGPVACELAVVYAALGSGVTIVEQEDRLLGRMEPFAAEAVAAGLREQGVRIRTGAAATKVTRPGQGGEVTVDLDNGESITADEVLVAVGRVPNTADLGLESVGATTDEKGYLPVTERMEVKGVDGDEPWLYAVGDVNGIALLTHMGKYQGRACGDLVGARATGRPVDPSSMTPWAEDLGTVQVVWTDPEVAATGLTEQQARERGIRVRVVEVPMDSAAGSGLQAEGYQGRARMVVDEDHGTMVGATLVGQDVAELVHPATVAIVGRVPLRTLWHAVPAFPSMSEIWLRLLEEYGI
jgi:dihydrolipoamide dehydrogenase